MTDQQLQELQQRNTERTFSAIQGMGKTHLLHPANQVKRKTKRRNKTTGKFY